MEGRTGGGTRWERGGRRGGEIKESENWADLLSSFFLNLGCSLD